MARKNPDTLFVLNEEDVATEYSKKSDIEIKKDKHGLVNQTVRQIKETSPEESAEAGQKRKRPAPEIKETQFAKPEEALENIEENDESTTFLGAVPENFPVLKSVSTGEKFKIVDNPYIIGKSEGCDLRIAEKVVSRKHAEITAFNDKHFIRDLNSLNGTFINGTRIPPDTEMELKNGAEVIFANKKFKYFD